MTFFVEPAGLAVGLGAAVVVGFGKRGFSGEAVGAASFGRSSMRTAVCVGSTVVARGTWVCVGAGGGGGVAAAGSGFGVASFTIPKIATRSATVAKATTPETSASRLVCAVRAFASVTTAADP